MAFAQTWTRWATTCCLVTTLPEDLGTARTLCDRVMDEIEDALSTWRDDSEIMNLSPGWNHVSATLAGALTAALWAARTTDGAVDPTLGEGVRRWRLAQAAAATTGAGDDEPASTSLLRREGLWRQRYAPPAWTEIEVVGRLVWLPGELQLDLGALGKAFAADLAARLIARAIGGGVLVNLGGDIATAGPGPLHGWQIRVHDGPDDPELTVTLDAGMAIATSSTLHRRIRQDDPDSAHVLDPRTHGPVRGPWRTATAVAATCVAANTWSTAALVLGGDLDRWLSEHPAPLRLVDRSGRASPRCGFPEERTA